MKTCYFDCPAGAAGDMVLAALIDAGYPAKRLREAIVRLGLAGVTVKVGRVKRSGVIARTVTVRDAEKRSLRVLPGIRRIIRKAGFSKRATERAVEVFTRLAEAEAKVHGMPVDKIHFHEIGAVDTIVDIVGTVLALEDLGVDRVEASPLPLGRGEVTFSHGTLPLPAPATVELLKGVPVYGVAIEAETVTPTGAALLSTLADSFGPLPAVTPERIGYGAGSRTDENSPNLLRAVIGESAAFAGGERAVLIEANVDDMVPEQLAYLMDRLLDAGVLDVTLTPTVMKKGRPGTIVSVLAKEDGREQAASILFAESTTIGVRYTPVGRTTLARETVSVKTRLGSIRVKVARAGQRVLNVAPEFADCRRVAEKKGVPLKRVYAEATRAAAESGLVPS